MYYITKINETKSSFLLQIMLTSEAVQIHASTPQHMHTQDKLQKYIFENLL